MVVDEVSEQAVSERAVLAGLLVALVDKSLTVGVRLCDSSRWARVGEVWDYLGARLISDIQG